MHRVLHLTDTHLRAPGVSGEPADVDPDARFDAVLAAVAAQGWDPDLIVHTGDIADDESAEAVERVHARLAAIAPTIAVPGNHDDPAVVREVFGPARRRVGGWDVIGIDTVIPGEVAGHADELADVVRTAERPTILLMHHPILSHSTHPWFRVAGGPAAQAALAASPHPWLVLSGHTHQVYEARQEGGRVRLWGGPAVFYALRHTDDTWERSHETTGARLIELAGGGGVSSRLLVA